MEKYKIADVFSLLKLDFKLLPLSEHTSPRNKHKRHRSKYLGKELLEKKIIMLYW